MGKLVLFLALAWPAAAGCRCDHSTRWWLSAVAVLAASSVYAATDKSLEQMPPANGYERATGRAVTHQLGVHFGITGAALGVQWFALHHWGPRHPKLEPIFSVVNSGGALALTTAASVELSQKNAAVVR